MGRTIFALFICYVANYEHFFPVSEEASPHPRPFSILSQDFLLLPALLLLLEDISALL